MQEISDDLIDRFFKRLCTKEEAARVADYLKKHPDHAYLTRAWDSADGETPLPAHTALEMYDAVAAHISKKEKSNVKVLWRMLAAACITGTIISLLFISTRARKQQLPAAGTDAAQVEWVERQNTQATAIVLMLPDASKVTLSSGTWIRYRKDFAQQLRRDIYMKGDAYYEVSKNKEKPFTVYSGYISTTALGTAFRVTALEKKAGIKVRLQEGKVLVLVTDTTYKKIHKSYYLLPGQELVFDNQNKPGMITAFNKKSSDVKSPGNHLPQQNTERDASYMFNNQTLADVLDQLAGIYHVSITYSKQDIGKIYFIGRIEKNDPVEKTIQDIALLNKLSVKKQNGGFILKRKKH